MSKKKKIIIGSSIAGAVVVIAAIVVGCILAFGSKGNAEDTGIYADKVADVMYSNIVGVDRYSGVVEAENTLEIKKDDSKPIAEIHVAVGDAVEVGTPLYTYDVEEVQNQKKAAQLELEGLNNEAANYDAQISELTKEKKEAPSDQQLDYTLRIQELQTQQKQCQYNISTKNSEIAKYDETINNATVNSTMAGTVKSINETEDMENPVFMTIVASGKYRIKGKMDEQSFYYSGLSEGMEVIVRSRVDESMTWRGTISKFDTENPEENNNNGYYGESSGETASKYPFYIDLENCDNLMIGQHVYIEPDYGQSATKEGMWLDESYIVFDGDATYIWALDKKDRLELRSVELGEYDAELMMYEIASGLSEDDFIVWNTGELTEGTKATKWENMVEGR